MLRTRRADPRKQRLIRLATFVALSLMLDLLILGSYFVMFDWFSSNYLAMHQWKSLSHSLNKALDWKAVKWKSPSGLIFICVSMLSTVTMTPLIVYFAASKRWLMLDWCFSLCIFHLLIVWNIVGLPTVWQWWVLKLATLLIQITGTQFLAFLIIRNVRLPVSRPTPIQRATQHV